MFVWFVLVHLLEVLAVMFVCYIFRVGALRRCKDL